MHHRQRLPHAVVGGGDKNDDDADAEDALLLRRVWHALCGARNSIVVDRCLVYFHVARGVVPLLVLLLNRSSKAIRWRHAKSPTTVDSATASQRGSAWSQWLDELLIDDMNRIGSATLFCESLFAMPGVTASERRRFVEALQRCDRIELFAHCEDWQQAIAASIRQ
jgi:hypothetical protein